MTDTEKIKELAGNIDEQKLTKEERFHDYACVALNALIGKAPLKHHSEVGEDEIMAIRSEMAQSALDCAGAMYAAWCERFKEERR